MTKGRNISYIINEKIRDYKDMNILTTDEISDGYHTFGELYKHRIELFIAICRLEHEYYDVWMTYPKDGWFILGLGKENGKQITYHLPAERAKDCYFAELLEEGEYEYDGHTSADVLERLKEL